MAKRYVRRSVIVNSAPIIIIIVIIIISNMIINVITIIIIIIVYYSCMLYISKHYDGNCLITLKTTGEAMMIQLKKMPASSLLTVVHHKKVIM